MTTSAVSQSYSNREMMVSEEASELLEWEHAKKTIKNRIESLSQTTFEIYGLHYRMDEFPYKYLELTNRSSGLDITGVRRQFYGPFKQLEKIAREIQRNLKNFSFLQAKVNEFAKRDDADPLILEMQRQSRNALKFVNLFNLSLLPSRGMSVGIKRRSPTLLDEETRIVRQKTGHAKNHCAPVLMDEESKTGRV